MCVRFSLLLSPLFMTESPPSISNAAAVVRQRSLRVRKTLRDLINKPKPVKQQNNLTLPLPHLPDDQHHESNPSVREEYVYDILYECQRGQVE